MKPYIRPPHFTHNFYLTYKLLQKAREKDNSPQPLKELHTCSVIYATMYIGSMIFFPVGLITYICFWAVGYLFYLHLAWKIVILVVIVVAGIIVPWRFFHDYKEAVYDEYYYMLLLEEEEKNKEKKKKK